MTTGNSVLDQHLNNTVGCVFIGILFELMYVDVHGLCVLYIDRFMHSLYGFSIAQTQYYFHEYPCDRLYIQIMVRSLELDITAFTEVNISSMMV